MVKARAAKVEIIVSGIVLELTRDEAQALRAICGRVTGDPVTSRRLHIRAIHTALGQADVTCGDSTDLSGILSFKEMRCG